MFMFFKWDKFIGLNKKNRIFKNLKKKLEIVGKLFLAEMKVFVLNALLIPYLI